MHDCKDHCEEQEIGELEVLGNAYEMAYQDFSQMVRRGQGTAVEIARAKAELGTLERSIARKQGGTPCLSQPPCRRIRLNFDAIPELLYVALLDEFRRQCPDYDACGIGWRWDVVASDQDHPEGGVIFDMAFTPDDDAIPDDE